jgi:hypothetical protein
MSLRTVVGLVIMQNLGFAVTFCKYRWWDLRCVELLCCTPDSQCQQGFSGELDGVIVQSNKRGK